MAKELSKSLILKALDTWKTYLKNEALDWVEIDEQAYEQILKLISQYADKPMESHDNKDISRNKVSKEFVCQKTHDFVMEWSMEALFDDVREFFVRMLQEAGVEVGE